MKSLFRADNPIFEGIGKLSDLVGLSVLWVLCCLPVFTIGPASAALYDCAVRCVRRGEDSAVYARFFRVFRENFKVGALTSLLWLGLWALLAAGYGFIAARAEEGVRLAVGLRYAYRVLYLFPAGATCWLFPLLSRFTFNVKALSLTAVQMAAAHLPATLGVLLLTALSGAACAFFFFPLLFLPCVNALLCSLFIERAFARHVPPEETKEEEGPKAPA